MRPRQGWILLDVLMGMIIVSILGTLLGAAAAMHDRAAHHLDDTRAATRQAESALLMMQSHQIPPEKPTEKPTVGNGGFLTVKKLPTPSQIPNTTWIEVRATVHTRTAALIGLVPQNALGEK
jgi:type II secretory pathway pseudopilin PulG